MWTPAPHLAITRNSRPTPAKTTVERFTEGLGREEWQSPRGHPPPPPPSPQPG